MTPWEEYCAGFRAVLGVRESKLMMEPKLSDGKVGVESCALPGVPVMSVVAAFAESEQRSTAVQSKIGRIKIYSSGEIADLRIRAALLKDSDALINRQ
jgi:hypothetical protein